MSFQIYCAIKLLKGKYINKSEAMDMCGFSENEGNKLDLLIATFEKQYKNICDRIYTDIEWEEDPEER